MRIYIIYKDDKYQCYKVSDRLVDEFKENHQQNVVVEASNVGEALSKFAEVKRNEEVEFNTALQKFKGRNQALR